MFLVQIRPRGYAGHQHRRTIARMRCPKASWPAEPLRPALAAAAVALCVVLVAGPAAAAPMQVLLLQQHPSDADADSDHGDDAAAGADFRPHDRLRRWQHRRAHPRLRP